MRLAQRLYTLRLRARALFRRNQAEQELDDELRDHLEQLIQQHVAAGVTHEEARRLALQAMGGVEQQKERCRDARGVSRLEQFWQDLRFGARMLRKNPGFTVVAVIALALGIGANTAIFSLVYGVLYRPLPYPEANRVAMVFLSFSGRGSPRGTLSMADFFDWRQRNQSFEEPVLFSVAGGAGLRQFDITGDGETEQVRGAAVTTGFFPTLRAEPFIGRVFASGEDAPGSQRLVVLSAALWRRRFGADPNAVGRSITLNGVPHTIVGILPDSFRFARLPDAQLWTNLLLVPPTRRGPFFYNAIARLKPGVTIGQAQAETNAIAAEIQRESKGTYRQVAMPVVPLRDAVVDNVRTALLVLFGAVSFVLLISTVNVANLSLSRAQAREREIALRSALGANRARIVRQLLTESLLLSSIGGLTGIAVAYGALSLLRAMNPANLPRLGDVRLDSPVLAFTMGVSVVAGILFGLAPAIQNSDKSLDISLKQGGRGTVSGASSNRTRAALIVVETALSLVLLIGAGLFLRSFSRLQHVEVGIAAEPSRIVFTQVDLAGPRYKDNAMVQAFFDRLTEKLQSEPGLGTFALSDTLPPNRQGDNDTFVIQGQPWSAPAYPSTPVATIGPGYFRTLGIPIVSGRDFAESDSATSPPVAIVSENLAYKYFPGETAIGHRIKQSGPSLNNTPFMEIVGVVGNVKYDGLQSPPSMAYYIPQLQSPATTTNLVVRPDIPIASAADSLRRSVRQVDPTVVVHQPETLDDAMSESVAQPRFRTVLLGTFAALALLLAAVGIYGVIAYSVAQRSNEIGVRMALGARRRDVMGMVVRQGITLTALGLAIGCVAALALTRVLSDLLFAIRPTDPVTFISTTVLLLLVALGACVYPAWTAARVDPIIALRHD